MSNARRRAAQQMSRDGIRKLPRWSKGKRAGCATIYQALVGGACAHASCGKSAGYDTPSGLRCFDHARELIEQQEI